MKVAVFSSKPHDEKFLRAADTSGEIDFNFIESRLHINTVKLAQDHDAVCIFVNDSLRAETLDLLKSYGIDLITLRCAGFNNIDLKRAAENKQVIARVPAYSPYAVAEHTLALILSLNRKIQHAYNRVRESNFSQNGLLGFDLNNKTVGIIGTGGIGTVTARILRGFGCRVMAYDIKENKDCLDMGVEYTSLHSIFRESDIISLHCPLTPETQYLINSETIGMMKKGVMLINTSRGGLVDTKAVIEGLKSRKIGYLGLDVYEEEKRLFFKDLSLNVIEDDVFARLLTFPNVIITGHQAFFTVEALQNIAEITVSNIYNYRQNRKINEKNLVTYRED